MQLHHNYENLPSFTNPVLTIGSFDGVHKGHQKIIKRINKLAKKYSGESVIVTFHPHPRKVIYPKDDTLRLLTTIEEKLVLFEEEQVDHVVIVPFSIEFSQQSPREYLDEFIMKSFNPRCVVIGYDHRFGINREGDIHLLRNYAKENNFEVQEIQKQEIEDNAISSTKIRNALWSGEVENAAQFLGYPYQLSGIVTHGDQIGSQLGYPTANISISEKEKLIPQEGVYAVNVEVDGDHKQGMLYIGNRPTINTKQKLSLEVNIFDFDKDIYDLPIKVHLKKFIRKDEKFANIESLRAQLKKDKSNSLQELAKQESKDNTVQLAICILNYNGQEYLESYLPSVIEACPENGKVVVIDNASNDDSIEFLAEWFPEVEVVELSKNHGFAGGYNEGLQNMAAEYYFILNSDVKLTPSCIGVLQKYISISENIAAVQPKILSQEVPEEYEYAGAAGGMLDQWGYPYCRGRVFNEIEKDHNQYKSGEIHWASGAAMLVRSEVFHRLEGFDAWYFAHNEEIDLCWRIQKSGYQVHYCNEAVVYHLGGGTLNYGSPRKTFLNFRNNLATLLKNEDFNKLWWLMPLRLVLDGVAGLKFLLEGHPAATWAVIKAHFTIYSTFRKILEKRRYYAYIISKYSIGKEKTIPKKPLSILWNFYFRGKKKHSEF